MSYEISVEEFLADIIWCVDVRRDPWTERDGKTYVKVDIYFTAIGMFDIPSEKEINAVMKRMESERETA